ncbi:adenylyltransferase and sulfurtransferase MOCS3 [Diabrotica virgifera virgifera]|uniref:Adenylyltransferase and sulfurtransferase MOCS3 homolog n=1 Tax=Diabrotica virgifera virgifera TaxID=50390 RepID=A0ABM5IZX2_DIAVI|nr:adenylyltransferase and sulfurtransferase MOCS3 [Diabrotica virgifera virgifera]
MEHCSSVESLKIEIKELQEKLKQKQKLLEELLKKDNDTIAESKTISTNEIIRYSRQMIMPDITIDGQKALKNSKVLIVGVGGLGCPAALYLATAGVGKITLVDYDEVELSNLHRQVLHSEDDIGVPKVMSAYNKLKRINSDIKIIPIREHANSKTIENLLHNNKYDVAIDGTDNVATRYLLNDICVLHNIPLVSGSALQMEGQLTVYHYKDGPCYRCLFPVPPPAHTVTNCGDGGVLGPVPGTIGVLQALETIKIITQSAGVLSGRFLIFDGSTSTFRNVKLRPRNPKCDVCGDEPTITTLIDYEQFCGSSAHDKVVNINILDKEQEIDINKFCVLKERSVVIDVRPELEFKMCSLSHTLNYPYTKILKDTKEFQTFVEDNIGTSNNVFILCRRGNDSQRAVCYIKDKMGDKDIHFYNVKGGLHAYAKVIDPSFPIY